MVRATVRWHGRSTGPLAGWSCCPPISGRPDRQRRASLGNHLCSPRRIVRAAAEREVRGAHRVSGGSAMLTLPIHELRARISGPVLTPADDGLAAEISGFDPSVVSRPDITVGAATAADVAVALDFASRHRLQVPLLGSGYVAESDIPAALAAFGHVATGTLT